MGWPKQMTPEEDKAATARLRELVEERGCIGCAHQFSACPDKAGRGPCEKREVVCRECKGGGTLEGETDCPDCAGAGLISEPATRFEWVRFDMTDGTEKSVGEQEVRGACADVGVRYASAVIAGRVRCGCFEYELVDQDEDDEVD